ncbi:MAG TPA: SIMPL domain-containing protein [Pirellulales bacterium]
MKRFRFIAGLSLTFVFALLCRTVSGQSMGAFFEGISVTGNGEVSAKPDIVEINVRLHGNAELTDDAIIKHRDARERVEKAFEALKFESLKVEELNLAVRPGTSKDQAQLIMRGAAPATNTPPQVEVSSTMRVRVSKIPDLSLGDLMKTIGKLLDTAKDSGAAVGPSDEEVSMAYRYGRTASSSMVRFVISDAGRIREEAYQKAVDDAKARAERLAKLHSVKLGSVIGVQEITVSGDEAAMRQQPWEVASDAPQNKPNEIATDTMSGGSYRVRLGVRFAIEPTDKKLTAQTSTEQNDARKLP